jgi:hypothetical protein
VFGRKDKKAIAALPPLHQELVNTKQLTTSLQPAGWTELLTSLTRHEQTVMKHPLPPRVHPFIIPLFRVLLEDIPDDGYLGVRLDLRGSNAAGKSGPQMQLPVQPPVKKCIQHMDFDPWLAVEARLSNKAKLNLWVADLVRVRDITKRGSSGKTKLKTKRKATQRVRATLSVPGNRPVASPPNGVPGWCRITMARTDNRIVLDGRSKYPVPTIVEATRWSSMLGEPHQNAPGMVPIPGQLNNVLLLLGELFRWLPNATPAREAG